MQALRMAAMPMASNSAPGLRNLFNDLLPFCYLIRVHPRHVLSREGSEAQRPIGPTPARLLLACRRGLDAPGGGVVRTGRRHPIECLPGRDENRLGALRDDTHLRAA